MMGLIEFTTHVFADDIDTEIQTSTEVTDKTEANADADDSQTEDSKISDGSETIATKNGNSSESNEMDKIQRTDSAAELENTEELYAMDSDTNGNEIATIAEKRNLFIDPNGGTYGGSSEVTSINLDYGALYELNEIPVRDGYTFVGWKSSENGVLHSGNWSDKSDEITLTEKKDNDGVVYSNYVLNYTNNTQNITWPNIYFFNYLYESGHTYELSFDVRVNSLSGLKYISIRHAAFRNNWVTPASNLSYVIPEWTHETLTRTFTGNTFTQDGVEAELNPLIELFSELSPGNTGKFNLDLKNITVYDVTAKKYVSSLSNNVKAGTTFEMGDSDATVTAVWKPNNYKVSYDINGGIGTIEDQSFAYGNTDGATISTTKPTKKGYTFAGWRWDDPNDESNFRLFDPGDKIPSDLQDFTLHAMWVANEYHVTFEGNGADSGAMSDEAFTYDDNEKSLTSNSFTREGYRFVGWNTKADGSGQSYTDAQAVKNLSEGGKTILVNTNSLQFNQTRYGEGAGGSAETGLVTINNNPVKFLNDLTSGMAYSTTVVKTGYGGVYSYPLSAFTSDCKTFFAGKKLNISFKAKSDTSMYLSQVGFESASTNPISLENQWNTYSITCKMNDPIAIYYGLTFYAAQQTGTYYVGDLNVTMGGEVKLYAQWEPVTYTNVVEHWAYGFKQQEGTNVNYGGDAYKIARTTFQKKYNEKIKNSNELSVTVPNGFYLRDYLGTSSYSNEWQNYSRDTEFTQPAYNSYAHFYYYPINYSITYKLDGGTLEKDNPSTYNVLYGVDFMNEPTKKGYRFLGWYIGNQKVSGINVGASATFSSSDDLYAKLKTRTTGNQTVTAKWEKLTDLKVNAAVSGNMGSRDKEFSFTTQFPSSLYGKTLTVEKSDGTTDIFSINSNGVCTFTLKHGESITFKDLTAEQVNVIKALPDLGVKEQDCSSEGYSTAYSVSSETDGTLVVSYRNTKQSAVPTGNHIGTGITAVVVIGIVGLVIMLRRKRK